MKSKKEIEVDKMIALAERKAAEIGGPAVVVDIGGELALMPLWWAEEKYPGAEIVAVASPAIN